MKKNRHFSHGILVAFLLSSLFLGCAQKEIVFNQNAICQAPIADIFLQSVYQKDSQSTTNQKEFEKILLDVIDKTGCIRLINAPKDGTYVLNATYEIKVQNEEKKELFKNQSSNTLIAKVILNLGNQSVIRRNFGESKISVKENKILGIGESEQISKDDEEKALKSSALAALKGFIADMQKQSAQAEGVEAAQDSQEAQNPQEMQE